MREGTRPLRLCHVVCGALGTMSCYCGIVGGDPSTMREGTVAPRPCPVICGGLDMSHGTQGTSDGTRSGYYGTMKGDPASVRGYSCTTTC